MGKKSSTGFGLGCGYIPLESHVIRTSLKALHATTSLWISNRNIDEYKAKQCNTTLGGTVLASAIQMIT